MSDSVYDYDSLIKRDNKIALEIEKLIIGKKRISL